ncbi:MAG: hypothetical protein IKO46_05890 [Salinivirgaceae bacterium]|nr:hypothetical protein [Salinivirgaceae bacterium]
MGTKKQNAACRKARSAKTKKTAKKSLGCAKKLSGRKSKKLVRRKKGLGAVESAGAAIVKSNTTAVKIAVGAAAAGLTFLVGRKIVRKIKEAKEGNELRDAIAAIPVNSKNTTIDETTAATISGALLGAMNKWGTDEETIRRNIDRLKTKDDYLLVYKAFKDKGYKNGKLNADGRKLDLTGWLRAELSGSDLKYFENKLQEWGVE